MATQPVVEDFTLSVYRGMQGLRALERRWSELARRLDPPAFYQCTAWYRAYLAGLESDPEQVYFFAYAAGERLAAVFPLKWKRWRRYGIELGCLELPEHSHANLADFVCTRSSDNAALLHRLIADLRHMPDLPWDALRLTRVPEDGVIGYCLAQVHPPRLVSFVDGESHYIECDAPYESIAGRMPGPFRRNLGRLRRRAEALGRLEFRSYSSPETLCHAFDAFLEMEASGWKGRTASAIACVPRVRRFYDTLMTEFGTSGQCVINELSLDGLPVASQFCLHVGRTLAVLKIAFRESHRHIAPGNLLFDQVLRDCCERPDITSMTFVTAPKWDHPWRPATRALYTHKAFNTTWRGLLVYALTRGRVFAARSWRWVRLGQEKDTKRWIEADARR